MNIELKQAAQQALEAFDAFGDADDFATMFALTQKMNALRTALQQAEAQQPATAEPVAWFEYSEQHKSWFLAYTRNPHVLTRPLVFGDTHPAPGVPDDVARDAERYRWLRSLEHCNEAWCLIGSGNANSNLDAAIDAAMLAASPAQKGGE